MTKEINNEIWMLRSARLDQASTVQKLLKEGFEPFWGTTVYVSKEITDNVIEKEKVVRMYFRKPPVTPTVELAPQSGSFDINIEPLSNELKQFNSIFSGMLDRFLNRFFERLDEYEPPISGNAEKEFVTKREVNLEEELRPVVEEDDLETENENVEGDKFRVVDDVPPITTAQRTPEQDSAIEGLRLKGNVTILPGLNDDGSVRVMLGADLYTIAGDGNFTVENTGAGTTSEIVAG